MGKEFTELEAWQKAQKLALLVCREVIPLLPAEEKYALAQQLRRAVQSAPANIAEGHGRYHYQDAIRFCYIARGSLQEALSQGKGWVEALQAIGATAAVLGLLLF